jgi:hypothetical protein
MAARRQDRGRTRPASWREAEQRLEAADEVAAVHHRAHGEADAGEEGGAGEAVVADREQPAYALTVPSARAMSASPAAIGPPRPEASR